MFRPIVTACVLLAAFLLVAPSADSASKAFEHYSLMWKSPWDPFRWPQAPPDAPPPQPFSRTPTWPCRSAIAVNCSAY